jgi:hypothetical protein
MTYENETKEFTFRVAREFIDENIMPIVKEIKEIKKKRGPYRTDIVGKSGKELDELFRGERNRLEELHNKRRELVKQCSELYPGSVIAESSS